MIYSANMRLKSKSMTECHHTCYFGKMAANYSHFTMYLIYLLSMLKALGPHVFRMMAAIYIGRIATNYFGKMAANYSHFTMYLICLLSMLKALGPHVFGMVAANYSHFTTVLGY